jgi:hypothetical protein
MRGAGGLLIGLGICAVVAVFVILGVLGSISFV